jgi:putative nucleotidyltransferase with HDIG domain
MRLVNGSPVVDFGAVSRTLMADAAFSSEVLRVANSALFAVRSEVTSILQALCFIGADRVRDLVVTLALKNYACVGENIWLQRFWRHNLATALWCDALADHCNIDRPLGYTAGILHDIGRMALLMLFPGDYAAFLNHSLSGEPATLEAERKLCDADHCQVGEYLAAAWHFPRQLVDGIAHHHKVKTNDAPRERFLVQAACTAAKMSGFHAVGTGDEWDPARIAAMLPQSTGIPTASAGLRERVVLRLNRTECSLL